MLMFPSIFLGKSKKLLRDEEEDVGFEIPGLSGITAKGGILGTGGKIGDIHLPYSQYQPTTVYHEPFETFAPQVQFAPVSTYAYQGGDIFIESPGASSKKEIIQDIVSKPEQRGLWEIPQTVAPHYEQPETTTTGLNVLHVAIIGVVGFMGYTYLKGKKR